MKRKRSFIREAIEAQSNAGSQLHIARLDRQLETRRAVAVMETQFPRPELRTGGIQDQIDAARHAAGMPVEMRVCNCTVAWESPDDVLRKAIKSGVKNLAAALDEHVSNEQFSTEYRTIFGRAPDGLSRSDLAEEELMLTQTAAALETATNLLEE
jgi:hypothetical protein